MEAKDGEDKASARSKGVAMLIALLVTAMVMLFLTELKISSTVSNRISLGNHLNVKGEYIAKSGANLGVFLLSADLAIELTAFELSPDARFPPIWNVINGLPIGGETLELVSQMQESFDLSTISDSKVLDQLKDFDGSFALNVEDETAKINVNFCGIGNGIKCMTMLEALFSCPAEREFLERKKIEAKDLITLIRDYVDENDRPDPKAIYSSESDPYEENNLGGEFPKNAGFDSVDELRYIPGWDNEIHQIFAPYLTVFPIPDPSIKQSKLVINYNSAGREMLGCLLPKSNEECSEQSALYHNQRQDLPPVSNTGGIKDELIRYHCSSDEALSKQFTYRSDVFRINVDAQVEDQTRKLSIVVKRGLPDEFDKKEDFKGAYKYLYWKIL